MMNKNNSRFSHLFPIVRVDMPIDSVNPENSVAVVQAYESEEHAIVEAERLNVLNADKGCRYFTCISRLVPA